MTGSLVQHNPVPDDGLFCQRWPVKRLLSEVEHRRPWHGKCAEAAWSDAKHGDEPILCAELWLSREAVQAHLVDSTRSRRSPFLWTVTAT